MGVSLYHFPALGLPRCLLTREAFNGENHTQIIELLPRCPLCGGKLRTPVVTFSTSAALPRCARFENVNGAPAVLPTVGILPRCPTWGIQTHLHYDPALSAFHVASLLRKLSITPPDLVAMTPLPRCSRWYGRLRLKKCVGMPCRTGCFHVVPTVGLMLVISTQPDGDHSLPRCPVR